MLKNLIIASLLFFSLISCSSFQIKEEPTTTKWEECKEWTGLEEVWSQCMVT